MINISQLNNKGFNIDEKILKLTDKVEDNCKEVFKNIEKTARINGEKVLKAFIDNKVSETCMKGTTGYGYGDVGRDTLDAVYAQVFGAEDALVRHSFVSGTHALTCALFGILRTGDKILSLTGRPYDTLTEVIGLSGNGGGSLKDYGVIYDEVDLLPDGKPDYHKILNSVKCAKVAYIQRSRGYAIRPALTIDDIRELVRIVRSANSDAIIMVDNCYGEFIETIEPTNVGVDLIIGSLIKNPGGGIAETGGYIAGRKDCVEMCAYRLTCVGMGKEVGCTLNQNKLMYQGLFYAPEVVASAVKTATFTSEIMNLIGFESFPKSSEKRGDIVTTILMNSPENLIAFCQGIQKGAPVDSFVSPEPWDMPGYDSQVIMAAGAFNMGASIEISADAPLREPFAAYFQGGLTYPTGRMGVLVALQEMYERNCFTL